MDQLASLPPQLESFHRELCDDLHADLGGRVSAKVSARRYGAAPTFAFPGSLALVETFTRAALNYVVEGLGDGATAFILAHKDDVRAWIGEPVLEAVERIVHGLEDVKPQAAT